MKGRNAGAMCKLCVWAHRIRVIVSVHCSQPNRSQASQTGLNHHDEPQATWVVGIRKPGTDNDWSSSQWGADQTLKSLMHSAMRHRD